MGNDELETGITVEWIDTDEEPFKPGTGTEIFIEMEPVEEETYTYYPPEYTDFYNSYISPPSVPYVKLPTFTAPKKEIIINIETTGVLPWESRLATIGVLDPNSLEPEVMSFIQETEEATLQEFIDWFESSPYETIIGYNVAFDYRFLYALMQKYRKTAPSFMDANLYDLMQQQKQVKAKFVYGFNKPGTLEDWSMYLFGIPPYAPQKTVFKWIREGNIDEIVNFNADKVLKAYLLWVSNKVVEGSIPGLEILARPTTPTAETPTGAGLHEAAKGEENIKVACPICLQEQVMSKRDKVINCFVCGNPIANPSV